MFEKKDRGYRQPYLLFTIFKISILSLTEYSIALQCYSLLLFMLMSVVAVVVVVIVVVVFDVTVVVVVVVVIVDGGVI